MSRQRSFSLSFFLLGAVLLLLPVACAQDAYYTPGGVGGPATVPPGMGYTGPGMGYTGPGGYEMGSETAPGPIVARPFTAQPPRVLLGERMKEEDVDLKYVDVEAFTGVRVTEDQIPRVNTLEEYRKVLSEQVPAIFFDGEVYIYDERDRTYKPRDWEIEEHNKALWAQMQYERKIALQVLAQQQMQARMAEWRVQQSQMRAYAMGQGTPVTGAPTAGAPTTRAAAGAAPVTRTPPGVRR